MSRILQSCINFLPPTSVFRFTDPIYLRLLIVAASLVTGQILLQLSWQCFGYTRPFKKTILISTILGLLCLLVRQVVHIPYHILVNIVILAIFIRITTKANLIRTLIATMFTESIIIVGSIMLVEPLMMMSIKFREALLYTSPGYTAGIILENFIPAIILFALVKLRFSLLAKQSPPDTSLPS